MQRAIADLSDYRTFDAMPSNEIESFANEMTQKYNAAPAGSSLERMYDQARRIAFNQLIQTVQREMQSEYDFRNVEWQAQHYDQLYNASPSGSVGESAYNQIRRNAYAVALNLVSGQLYQMPQSEIYQIENEYSQKYNSAPAGSPAEQYFRQVRDMARNALGHP